MNRKTSRDELLEWSYQIDYQYTVAVLVGVLCSRWSKPDRRGHCKRIPNGVTCIRTLLHYIEAKGKNPTKMVYMISHFPGLNIPVAVRLLPLISTVLLHMSIARPFYTSCFQPLVFNFNNTFAYSGCMFWKPLMFCIWNPLSLFCMLSKFSPLNTISYGCWFIGNFLFDISFVTTGISIVGGLTC